MAPAPRSKRRYKKFSDRGRCRFCRPDGDVLDYKNIAVLNKLCTSQARLFSRKRSGNCAKHQRQLKRSVKYARFLALMPYTG